MKQRLFYMLIALALLFQQHAFAQNTFTWDSVTPTNGEPSLAETIGGITATVTASSGEVRCGNFGGYAGSSGNLLWAFGTVTVSFNDAIDITSMNILNASGSSSSAVILTPTGGSNNTVVYSEDGIIGRIVTVNWIGVTSFTISIIDDSPIGLDTVIFTGLVPPCTSPTAATISATNSTICSGTTTTLNISGNLNSATQWAVYTGSCGGTLIGTTTASSINVNPTSTTTYYVRGEGGCVPSGDCATFTITVTPRENASFSYAASAYCQESPDPTPTVSGVNGGNFSSTPVGLSINATTGAIDVSASNPGTYSVNYATTGLCNGNETVTVTINAIDGASFNYSASSYCKNSSDPTPTISGLAGGTFNSGEGLFLNSSTGAIDVSASIAGTYTVSYTTSGPCVNSSTVTVTISANADASFNYSAFTYCNNSANPTPTISGLTGGTFSSQPPGLAINETTGLIDAANSSVGSYSITYTLSDECSSSKNVMVDIISGFTVVIEPPVVSCGEPSATLIGAIGITSEIEPDDAPTYLWTTLDGVIEGDTNELETLVGASGTYTLTVTLGGCSFSEDVVVDFDNILLVETTWDGEEWSNGEPEFGMKAIIDADLIVDSFFTACELVITENGSFTVLPFGFAGIIGKITNNAAATDFVIENGASLAQITDVQNVGPVTVNVTSFPLYRQDYTLWSSPVENQNLRGFSPQTLFNRFKSYNAALGTAGEYVQEIFTTADVLNKTFAPANGYLIRSPNNWAEYVNAATPGVSYGGVFTGVPQNGPISVPLATVNGGFNLVGNPYPSPLQIDSVLDEELVGIERTIYFWRKRNGAAGSGYATYNDLGFSSAQPELGSFAFDFEDYPVISPGQGFFIKSTGATAFNFTNDMRVPFSNGLFLRTASSVEKHRIWLNLENTTGIVGQTLIGYVSGATSSVDNGFDSTSFNDSSLGLTSLINGVEYTIQGLGLPFDTTSTVALGFKTDAAGTYSISLSNFDGLFTGDQDIYIKDNVTGMVHNVKESAYSFTANAGIANDRFEVVYTNSVLGTANPDLLVKNILVAVKDQSIIINAGTVMMDTIELIDLAGRVIYTQNDVNATTATIENVLTSNQMLVVRITTAETGIVNKKIIY